MIGHVGTSRAFRLMAAILTGFMVLALCAGNVEARTLHAKAQKHRVKISVVQKKYKTRKTKMSRTGKRETADKTRLVHGMLAEYNSLGYQQIKVDKTGQMLKVGGWTQTSEQLTKTFGDGRDKFAREIHGDFTVKMIRADRPGEQSEVKIVGARNIVVMKHGRVEFRAPTAQAAVNMEPRFRSQNSRFAAGDRPTAGPELAPEYQTQNLRL